MQTADQKLMQAELHAIEACYSTDKGATPEQHRRAGEPAAAIAGQTKTKQTHTPGPWNVGDRRQAALPNVGVFAGDVHVADVCGVHTRDPLAHSQWTQAEADQADATAIANAHLIASAPDLMEAVGILLSFLVFLPDERFDMAAPYITRIKATLEKARGRTQ